MLSLIIVNHTDHRVSVDVDQNAKKFFLGFCLSGLEDLEANDPIVPVFRQLVVSIVEVYHGFEKDWQTKVCQIMCLCINFIASFPGIPFFYFFRMVF